jgi:hypothetical protein
MQRCPVCRAPFKEASPCYRCGADLSPLMAIDRQAEALERRAVEGLVAGNFRAAVAAARQAVGLKHDALAVSLLGFAGQVLSQQESDVAAPEGAGPAAEQVTDTY